MKKSFILLSIFFSTMIITFSCGKKNTDRTQETEVINTNIHIEHAQFNNNWNVQYDESQNLTRDAFDSLKLGSLSFIPEFEYVDFQVGQILFDNKQEKLLTIKSIASGEIAEYLLGYSHNNITDSLLVAYEDNVEYYSETYSTIENNKITVTTVNRDYTNTEEIADTIVTVYNISPKLTFDEVFEE